MKKILIMIGTRPECIKLAPLAAVLSARKDQFDVTICLTSQHREMLQQALDWFPIKPDYDLDLMTDGQHLVQLQARILENVKPIIDQVKPDYIVVQGDTTTAMASATAGCFLNVTVVHVEAGLRTFDRYAPWPEEINRLLISKLAEVHLAPTETNAAQLRSEKVDGDVVVVGNTVIDALLQVRDKVINDADTRASVERAIADAGFTDLDSRFILVTGHRRESFGDGMHAICDALERLATQHSDLQIVYAVHLNPQVKDVMYSRLASYANIKLLPPMEYGPFVYLMERCFFILSDSGGIQEEAPSLNKPVLVMRDSTERIEAVNAGAVKLVGTNADKILQACEELLSNPETYQSMAEAANPFGDGNACGHIADFLQSHVKAQR